MKKIVCLSVVTIIILCGFPVNAGTDHWAQDSFDFFVKRGTIKMVDYPVELYDVPITRGDFVNILINFVTISRSITPGAVYFNDVPASSKYYIASAKAHVNGKLMGYEDGSFRPDERITRQEMFVLLYRAFELENHKEKEKSTLDFPDKHEIAAYAADSVQKLSDLELIQGYWEDGTIRPEREITYAETFTILKSVVRHMDDDEALDLILYQRRQRIINSN